jgi:hypothetical protein
MVSRRTPVSRSMRRYGQPSSKQRQNASFVGHLEVIPHRHPRSCDRECLRTPTSAGRCQPVGGWPLFSVRRHARVPTTLHLLMIYLVLRYGAVGSSNVSVTALIRVPGRPSPGSNGTTGRSIAAREHAARRAGRLPAGAECQPRGPTRPARAGYVDCARNRHRKPVSQRSSRADPDVIRTFEARALVGTVATMMS